MTSRFGSCVKAPMPPAMTLNTAYTNNPNAETRRRMSFKSDCSSERNFSDCTLRRGSVQEEGFALHFIFLPLLNFTKITKTSQHVYQINNKNNMCLRVILKSCYPYKDMKMCTNYVTKN